MAASAKPMGAVPETKVVKDTEVSTSPAEQETHEEPVVQAQEDNTELDESDLGALEDQKKVPYSRFKEVNEKAKSAEQRIAEMQSEMERKLQREVELAELRIKAKYEQNREEPETLDPYTAKDRELETKVRGVNEDVSSIKEELAQLKLKDEMARLQKEYPEADQEAVLGWKRARPGADLEELFARSHNRMVERTDNAIKKIIEQKKQRAKQAIPTAASGIRLKEGEKPKSIGEAKALVKKFWGGPSRNR